MITFGPEWIRTLSNDGSTTSNSSANQTITNRSNNVQQVCNSHSSVAAAPRFADHRYGREEMLSLYDREINPPQELQDFGNIYVRRKQPPLALSDNSEDDNNIRHWQRQNSAPAGLAPPAVGPMGSSVRVGDSTTHAPRGRGRQRQFHVPGQNSITYHNSRFVGRGEDSQAAYTDSGRLFYSSWNDRGNSTFEAGGGEWNNQRRDFVALPLHSNRWSDWRRPGTLRASQQEEGEEPRRAAASGETAPIITFRHRSQVGSGSHPNRYSWRGKEEHDKSRFDRERGYSERDWGDRTARERGTPRTLRRGWSGDGNEENALPEWAVETTNTETSGSFVSLGAFHAPVKAGGDGDEPSPPLHPLTHSHSHSSFMSNKNISTDQQSSSVQNNTGLSRSLTQASFNISKNNNSKKRVSFAKEDATKNIEQISDSSKPAATVKASTANKNKQFDVTKINFKKVSQSEKVASSANLDWWSPGAMFVNECTTDNKAQEKSPEAQPPNQDFLDKPFSELAKDDKLDDLDTLSKIDTLEKGPEYIESEKEIKKEINDSQLANVNQGQHTPQMNTHKEKYDKKLIKSEEIRHTERDERTHSEPLKTYESTQHNQAHYDFNDESNIKSVLLTSTDKSLREQHQNFIQPTKESVTLPDLSKPPPQAKLPSQNLPTVSIMADNDNLSILRDIDRKIYRGSSNVKQADSVYNFMNENPVISQTQAPTMTQPVFQQSQISHSSIAPPSSSNLWYYQDPQGEMQGPFDASNMADWYNSGFFKKDLMVRRDCDLHLYPLGSLGITPPFLKKDPASMPPINAKAALNYKQTFAGVPDHLSQFPVPQQPDPQQLQMSGFPESRNLRLEKMMISNDDYFMSQQQGQAGVMNVNALPTALPPQPPISYYPTPSSQPILLSMVQPTLDSLKKSIASPVEQAALNSAASQPPLDETMTAFLRQLNVSDQQATTSSWDKQPKDSWNENMFYRPFGLWEKPFMEMNNQPTQLNSDLDMAPNISAPLSAMSMVSPNNKHERDLTQQPNALFEERSLTNCTESAYNIWENYQLQSVLKPGSPPKPSVVENITQDVIPNFNKFDLTQVSLPTKIMDSKEEEEKFYDMFPHCRPLVKEGKTEPAVKPAPEAVALQQIDEFSNVGFQKVPSKKEEKQLKLQKLKEAKKKADELRKLMEEEQLLGYCHNYRETEENLRRQHHFDIQKLQQESQKQRAINAKIAPWSAVTETDASGSKLSLSEIQKLEREKKLELVREQETALQQLIVQQQQQSQLREQEASQGWSKIATATPPGPQKSLNEIQMEELCQAAVKESATRKQAPRAVTPNQSVWAPAPAPGFWESMTAVQQQQHLLNKANQSMNKQATTVPAPAKKPEKAVPIMNPPNTSKNSKPRGAVKKTQTSATLSASVMRESTVTINPEEKYLFDVWCADELNPWKDKIDIPTFVNFLMDVQSSYDVKDYIKSIIGDTPEASLFLQQYLAKRSRLLRQGNDFGEDPSLVQNPKLNSNEFQEVKGKNKKVKKSKMLKVDARILGFSTTASEDRINVHK